MSNRKPYSAQFREQMVALVDAGRRPEELAKEFGCHVKSIKSWVKMSALTTPVRPLHNAALNATERQELLELRRKYRQVQMERDILAKATAWFAGKSEKTSTASTNS